MPRNVNSYLGTVLQRAHELLREANGSFAISFYQLLVKIGGILSSCTYLDHVCDGPGADLELPAPILEVV